MTGMAAQRKTGRVAIDVPCVHCGSAAGDVCLTSLGLVTSPHPDRRILRNFVQLDHPAWPPFAAWIMTFEGRKLSGTVSIPTAWSAFKAGMAAPR